MNSDQTVTYGIDTYRPDYEAGIPGENNLKTIGVSNTNLNNDFNPIYSNFNIVNDNAAMLSSQNINNMGLGLASSLLPSPDTQNNYDDVSVNVSLSNQVFLKPEHMIGINSTRARNNPNYDLRSAPPNPIKQDFVWNNTTIYPDLLRRPLECPPKSGIYSCGPGNISTSN